MTKTKTKLAVIHDWHQPHNANCMQNIKAAWDCTCEKPKRVVNRKPYRVCKVHDDGVPHGCRPDIVMEVHPRGRLIFRELGRRKTNAYATTVGEVFGRLVMNEAIAKMRAKKAAKKGGRK